MPIAIRLLGRPRLALAAACARPRPLAGAAVVVLAGLASLGFDSLAALMAPGTHPVPAPATFVVIPLLLLAFWAAGAWLINAGARLMAGGGELRRMLATSGQCFAVFAGYGLVGVIQAVVVRTGGGDGAVLAAGLLGLVLLGWFIALLGLAVAQVYGLDAPAAMALALLPFAALSAAVLLYILVISALHSVGVI